MSVPVIGISPNAFPAEDRHFYKGKALEYVDESMGEALRENGAFPMALLRNGVRSAEDLAAYAQISIATSLSLG